MKKLLAIILSIIMVFSLCACGNKETGKINCSSCGESISKDVAFCEHCGAANNVSDDILSEGSSLNEYSSGETNKPTESNKPTQTESLKPNTNKNTSQGGNNRCGKCGIAMSQSGYSYCNNCKCSSSLCKNAKSGNSDKYCSEHMCGEKGCTTMKEDGSLFCKHHNCDASYCKEAQSNGSRYCLQHKCNKCSLEKEDGSDFCSSHTCANGSCKAGQHQNSGYCIEHKCNYSNCSNPKQYSSSYTVNYCSSHDCRNCMRDRVDGSFYCYEHKCSVSGCTYFGNIGVNGIMYCNNHRPK